MFPFTMILPLLFGSVYIILAVTGIVLNSSAINSIIVKGKLERYNDHFILLPVLDSIAIHCWFNLSFSHITLAINRFEMDFTIFSYREILIPGYSNYSAELINSHLLDLDSHFISFNRQATQSPINCPQKTPKAGNAANELFSCCIAESPRVSTN
ncbi:hypothetical protein PRIPAC_80010 [Pristionchus pacificus]|uniref:Uncharacterized protein n=1 Tax=Pristionchus pacificus TaxID=54126 RepID=A0A2A6BDX7_PRIPA|nr:hypothetical protein PRIPAC_80010 [Pristionchus pacificus]|eukprot:PDM64056.1 hypothetical protein PRIPAC_54300 [Pristionchus pacificus]